MIEVKLQKISDDAIVPERAYSEASGYDLFSIEDKILEPGEYALIHTGWNIELSSGTEAQVRPKSGLALKHGITVLNTPGTIDADYRGEIGVILINHGLKGYKIEKGSKIAQLVISKTCDTQLTFSTSLTESARGARGFGSSGVKTSE